MGTWAVLLLASAVRMGPGPKFMRSPGRYLRVGYTYCRVECSSNYFLHQSKWIYCTF